MKKLIINEKNLPRPGKQTDSSIRIRINKTQLPPHQTVPLRKTPSSQLQDIELCLQTFEKSNNKAFLVDEEKINLIIQILKCYKDSLTINPEFSTQSVRTSKIKFKTIAEMEGKENYTVPLKIDPNNKQMTESERLQQILERPLNGSKSPKYRRYFSMGRKGENDEKDAEEEVIKNEFPLQSFSKEQDECIAQTSSLKLEEDKPQCSTTQQLHQSESQSEKMQKMEKLTEELALLRSQLQEKNGEINELNDRIEQLNINIQNLIKKNSLKAEEYNKLYQEYNEISSYYSQIHSLEQQLAQLQRNFTKLEEENKELIRKKQQEDLHWRKMQQDKNQQIQQQIAKFQTAQQSYELSKKNLTDQNQRLLQLLSTRQQELTHLYQVTANLNMDSASKESQICAN